MDNSISNIAALIPAYNPDKKMTQVIEGLKGTFETIIVVNDGCSSEYDPVFAELEGQVILLKHEVNRGKGCALKTGFKYIIDNRPDLLGVVTLDADGQHTAEDVISCCKVFLKNPKTSVFGCRDFFSDTTDIPERSKFGNRLTSRLLKYLCGIKLSDTQTGLRVLPASCLSDLLNTRGERYEYEMNMIFDLDSLGIGWVENQITVIYIDDNESSHFNPIKDSIKIYKVFVKYIFIKLWLFIKFGLSSLISCAIDLALFNLFSTLLHPFFAIIYVTIATAGARICSGIVNYSLNRLIFGSKTKVSSSGPKYFLLWLVQMSLSAGLVTLACHIFADYMNPENVFTILGWTINAETPVKFIIDSILFIASFFIQKKWVFKKESK